MPASPSALRAFWVLATLSVAHSAAVLALMLLSFRDGSFFLPVGLWTLFAWLWLLWLPILALHPGRTPRRLTISLVLASALLLPCAPVLVAFTAWSTGGFGP